MSGGIIVAAGVAVALMASSCGDDPLPSVKFVGTSGCPTKDQTVKSPSPPNVNSRPPVGQAIDEMPSTHLTPPVTSTYLHDPPTSGCHYSIGGSAPVPAGAYDKSIAPEYWVHNLEHGYIVVLYNCPAPPGCTAEFNTLHDWFKSLPPDPGGAVQYAKVLILPWATMKPKFAVVAWDWYDDLGSTLNMDEVKRFYENHVNQSTEGAAAQ